MQSKSDLAIAVKYGAVIYHADLPLLDREANMKEFTSGRKDLVFTTTAFGVGVDIPDIGFCIHAGAPYTLTNFVQESGRIGRNGKPAMSVIIYKVDDEFHSGAKSMGKDKIFEFMRLQDDCMRGFMSSEFDELPTTCFSTMCSPCGNCKKKMKGGK